MPAIVQSLRHTAREMGLVRGVRGLLRVNQPGGFDCPGCAWPDANERPDRVKFCENGAKAVAEEATRKRVTPAFFARNPVSSLAKWSDFQLGKAGRLTHPMLLEAGADHYRPVGWEEAFAVLAEELRALPSPDAAAFYTSGRASNEAAFLYQLFARMFGTNNLPDCSNMCHESSGVALEEVLGSGKGSVTLEDFDHVHGSRGRLAPASRHLRSEVAIVAGLAQAVLAGRGGLPPVDWQALAADYDRIRDLVEQVVPGFEGYNRRLREGGFHLPHAVRDQLRFDTVSGRAEFTVHPIPEVEVPEGGLLLMTLRSHDQFNTTIYGLEDRYRGVSKGRRAVFVNETDLERLNLLPGQRVDITSHFRGETRTAEGFYAVAGQDVAGDRGGQVHPQGRQAFHRGGRCVLDLRCFPGDGLQPGFLPLGLSLSGRRLRRLGLGREFPFAFLGLPGRRRLGLLFQPCSLAPLGPLDPEPHLLAPLGPGEGLAPLGTAGRASGLRLGLLRLEGRSGGPGHRHDGPDPGASLHGEEQPAVVARDEFQGAHAPGQGELLHLPARREPPDPSGGGVGVPQVAVGPRAHRQRFALAVQLRQAAQQDAVLGEVMISGPTSQWSQTRTCFLLRLRPTRTGGRVTQTPPLTPGARAAGGSLTGKP
jgi:hypothetical protein